MTDFVTINRLSENQFDEIVYQSGGKRVVEDDSCQTHLNADYVFENSVVELKFIDEEGLEKQARREKLANLFLKYDDSPVVVLDTTLLSELDRNTYYKILEGPIKGQIKKASKQLKVTCKGLGDGLEKGLIVVNNGYSALDQNEFQSIVKKCAKNDTKSIDWVVSCGIYYYSDGFDTIVTAPFELVENRGNSILGAYEKISNEWRNFIDRFMKDFVINKDRNTDSRPPVLDVEFDVFDRTFIKPAPPFGCPSSFYINGRPRSNSSDVNVEEHVATTFPRLSRSIWNKLKTILSNEWELKNSFEDWIRYINEEVSSESKSLRPLVQFDINEDDLEDFACSSSRTFDELILLANKKFNEEAKKVCSSIQRRENLNTLLSKYIYVVIKEIGVDQKNDLSSIYVISRFGDSENVETIVENERIYFEVAVRLASAYAVKNRISVILYDKNQQYSWI